MLSNIHGVVNMFTKAIVTHKWR